MSNIIVEGFDGSGKSFLAKHLAAQLEMDLFWAGGPPGSFEATMKCATEQLYKKNTVFDRITCISEVCYNNKLNSYLYSALTGCMHQHVANGDIIIYCSHIIGADDTGYNDPTHLDKIKIYSSEIIRRYDNLFSVVPHIRYMAKISDIGSIIERIKGAMK
jgi:ABC-type lipoprotein export system ATPase subunit